MTKAAAISTTERPPGTQLLKVAIVLGRTRTGRTADSVARWVHEVAARRGDAAFEILDIADHALAHLDEPVPPLAAQYSQPHTLAWARTVAAFDAFVFVTPEYNHSIPGALKNAIDFLYAEWNDKAAGFVSYGVDGGIRAVEHLRLVMGELKVADVRTHVALSFAQDFQGYTTFAARDGQQESLNELLDELLTWASALRALRTATPAPTGTSGP